MPRGPEGFAEGFEDEQVNHVLAQVISKVEALQNDLREGNFRLAMLHDLEERVQVLLSVETLHDGPALLTLDIEGRPYLEGIPVPYDLD